MEHELISDSDYDTLPEEAERRFLALERICRNNLARLITEDTGRDYDAALRMHYMAVVAAAADELGVEGLWFPSPQEDVNQEYSQFSVAVSRINTQLRLRHARKADPYTVQLARRTRARIQLEVGRLREIIENSDLPDNRKRVLFRKLDELLEEIEKGRVSFAKVMAVLVTVGAGVVVSGTSFLADAPDAIATITSLIGADKEAETVELERLGAPEIPKALPAPRPKPKPQPDFSVDDEIPF